uniref:RRM domain-containing protein n=1 Tax=Rhizophora mucronata TaxID=61149 RepID=A0A2P2LFC2_RHIMU
MRLLLQNRTPMMPHCRKESISKGTACNLPTQNSSKTVVDTTISGGRKMHEYPETIGKHPVHVLEIENTLHSSEATTSLLVAENIFKDVVQTTASEARKAEQFPENIDLSWHAVLTAKSKTTVDSSEVIKASHTCERDSSAGASCVFVTKSPEEMLQSEENSDISNIEMLENRHKLQEEAASGELVGCDFNQKKEGGQLFNSMHGLLNKMPNTVQNKSMHDFTSFRNENNQPAKKATASVLTLKADGMPSLSDGSQEVEELAHPMGYPARKSAVRIDHLTPGIEDSDGVSPKNVEGTSNIKVLIDYLMVIPGEQLNSRAHSAIMSNVVDHVRNKGSVDKIPSQNNLQNFEAKRLGNLSESHRLVKKINNINGIMGGKDKRTHSMTDCEVVTENHESESNELEIAANDGIEFATSPLVAYPTIKEHPNHIPAACSEGPTENKVLLRFLWKKVKERDILSAFEDCGPILKIQEVPSPKQSIFKDAFVYFKTKSGFKRAQNKTDVLVRSMNIIIEGTSPDDISNKISIPSLIGDPNLPVALVKNPTCVVKIKQLTPGISSHHLKEALTFCGGGITSFFLGSSSSVGYVEFEKEDAKEMALAKHSLHVLGKKLPVFRVDAPRTTVVRILNVDPTCPKNVVSIFHKHGRVSKILPRSAKGIVDVHFKLVEWPNMLNILNSLNGFEVDGKQWIAQPAPVFHPAILEVLWNHPDERRYVKALIHSMLRKIQQPINEYTDLAARYYDDN